MERAEDITRARLYLENKGLENLKYLGCGKQGIVFHDKEWVYKIIFNNVDSENTGWYRTKFRTISNDFFYSLEDVIYDDGIVVEKYIYEKTERVNIFLEEECIDFLVQCKKENIVIIDCKPENFVKVNGHLKMIDMGDCYPYSDNLFLNSCARMFIYCTFQKEPYLKKILRSAINNFNLPELKGLIDFINRVFSKYIYEFNAIKQEISKDNNLLYEVYTTENVPNLDKFFFKKIRENLYMSSVQLNDVVLTKDNQFVSNNIQIGFKEIKRCKKKVSLLIKTCAMDIDTIEQNIKHIVRQLSSPVSFYEIVVSIDSKKNDFLRQYTDKSNYDKVIEIVQKLKSEEIIDSYIIFDSGEATRINKEWFNLDTSETHSVGNVPISSQLYAFEKCNGDYILQMDSDVMIGRKDLNHDFLQDMLDELDKNEKVISVGFNIPNEHNKNYFGFENGGFVPEVRMCLFRKDRLLTLRPLPNSLNEEGKLKLTWYRAMEQYQKDTGYCSIRGGDKRTFFIHPQNYRKKESYAWMNILDRIEQGEIIKSQYGCFDCEGSFFDWCMPKRKEKLIVICYIRNNTISQFLRLWISLISQSLRDFGIILYDNCSDNGISILIQNIIKPFINNITYIKGRNVLPKLQCEFIAIRKFCADQQSIIVCIDGKNAIIGNNVLFDLYKKYEINMADATCGISYENDKLQIYYKKKVNFINPRQYVTNVDEGLISFRKYLFDSIPLDHFLYENKEQKLSERKWYDEQEDAVKMIPIIEMSSNPLQLDYINLYVDKLSDSKISSEEFCEEIKKKRILLKDDILFGRKKFETNINRIDIDITFACNLKCKGCIRSCGEAPSNESMTIQDIDNFINESIKLEKKWERINVLGGEPTLHPDFLKIIEHLQCEYADKFNNSVIIQVVSNLKTDRAKELCEIAKKYKNVKIDYNSSKQKNTIDYFTPFNDAPCDDKDYEKADFSKACWVTSDSGFGLNKNGYFACPNCSGIDRVFNFNLALKSFSDLTYENQKKQFEICCRYCGFFKYYNSNLGNFISRSEREPFKEIISDTWRKIYEEYKQRK